MDEMVIKSEYARKLISEIIEKSLRKKTGSLITVELGPTQVKIEDTVRVDLSCSIDIPKSDLAKIMKEAF